MRLLKDWPLTMLPIGLLSQSSINHKNDKVIIAAPQNVASSRTGDGRLSWWGPISQRPAPGGRDSATPRGGFLERGRQQKATPVPDANRLQGAGKVSGIGCSIALPASAAVARRGS